MKIGIVDCGGANLNSIYYSFKRLNIDSFISNSIDELSQMDALVLPGVGSAGKVMETLSKKNLINFIKETNKPVLGICIGMQILFDYSEEDNTECLGLIKGTITKFNKKDVIAVPQMGWNKVECNYDDTLNGYYYFA
ncbi:MAG: imidazole glycerol phosphate synthase subunit HisH, partial [Proteobacteria bacterium]|nr:imidazole glycerol phosphate synthase subunit HisH [Pseudomonadota bacterium]